VFGSHELHNAVSRNNIFYSRGRIYPRTGALRATIFKTISPEATWAVGLLSRCSCRANASNGSWRLR